MNLEPFLAVPYEGRHFCRVFAGQVLAAHGVPLPAVVKPERAVEWERVDRPAELDLVVFHSGAAPDHVGVCIGRGRFLHVEEGSRSRIEFLSSPLWSSRIEGYYRYKGEK
ncbi:NlpC/P60 family protein [Stenotrophomonas sp.]|uniref:NlpC/P60 family protein n=1 Tax=Stenotrophomonas sp. TaxID=69392 RepID=UPI0028B061C0|nr:NlpC/P60 family protein [Stenotrophomonas sp.]